MRQTPTPTRFHLSPAAERLSGNLLIDPEEHPEADLITLATALWAGGHLTGPGYPRIHVTTDYELLAAVTLADGTTIHSGAQEFLALTGAESSERTWRAVLDALAGLVGALNVELDALDAYVAARSEELTFLQLAIGFHDPSMVENAHYALSPSPIHLDGRTLLALLEAADELRPDFADLDGPLALIADDPDAITPPFEDVIAYVAGLDDDEPDEDGQLMLHRAATAAGITATLIDQFEDESEQSPSLVVETTGYLLAIASGIGLTNIDELVTVFETAGSGRLFRVGGAAQAGGVRVNLLTPPLPTAILSNLSGPTTPWRLLSMAEAALGAVNGAIEEHCEVLMEHFMLAEVEAQDQRAA